MGVVSVTLKLQAEVKMISSMKLRVVPAQRKAPLPSRVSPTGFRTSSAFT